LLQFAATSLIEQQKQPAAIRFLQSLHGDGSGFDGDQFYPAKYAAFYAAAEALRYRFDMHRSNR
jgi:hypothetical protein